MPFQGEVEAAPHIDQLTPAQKLRALQALIDLREGKIEMPPLRCGKCAGAAIAIENTKVLSCVACGARTTSADAHLRRRQEVARLIYEIGRGEGRVRPRRVPNRKPGK
jgi:hypothetical protein